MLSQSQRACLLRIREREQGGQAPEGCVGSGQVLLSEDSPCGRCERLALISDLVQLVFKPSKHAQQLVDVDEVEWLLSFLVRKCRQSLP